MSEEELAILYPEMYGEEDLINDLSVVTIAYLGNGNDFNRYVEF